MTIAIVKRLVVSVEMSKCAARMLLLVLLAHPLHTHTTEGTVVNSNAFIQSSQWQGTAQCTKLLFASNGEVFCGQKRGSIMMFPSITAAASTGKVIWDAASITFTWHDRGLLGLALHKNYPAEPFLWAFFTVNHVPDLSIPDTTLLYPDSKQCPNSNGYCDAASRFVRIRVDPAASIGKTDQILISDWCSGSGSHNTGDIIWAGDGGMYLASGDGSAFSRFVDFGVKDSFCYRDNDQRDQGSFRSQWDEYLHGKMLYLPLNSLMENRLLTLANNDFRIVAKGLRNPFRFAVHPVNGDIYIGDVGSEIAEEIDILPNPLSSSVVPNFGWPCFEGTTRHPKLGFRPFCDSLQAHVPPFFEYRRNEKLPTERSDMCSRSSVSPAAFAFRGGDSWGAEWANVLFWADSSLRCIFYFSNTDGAPDNSKLHTLVFTETEAQGTSGQWIDLVFGTGQQSRNLYALDYYPSVLGIITFTGETVAALDSSGTGTDDISYFMVSCALMIDDFEDAARFSRNRNLVPGPPISEGDTCLTASSGMETQLESGHLRLSAIGNEAVYRTDFAYGDRCFDADKLGLQFMQFVVFGTEPTRSFNVILRMKTESCNSVSDSPAHTSVRLWGAFHEPVSVVTIPLSVFEIPDLARLQGIEFRDFKHEENDDVEIEINDIKLVQACGISVPTLRPTLCSMALDRFSDESTNAFGGSITVDPGITATPLDNKLTLVSKDPEAQYTSSIFAGFCTNLTYYDAIEFRYRGSSFNLHLTSRESDCGIGSSADVMMSLSAAIPASTSEKLWTVSLEKASMDNIHSFIISSLTGQMTIWDVQFISSRCINSPSSSALSFSKIVAFSSFAAIGIAAIIFLGLRMAEYRRKKKSQLSSARNTEERLST